MAVLRNFTEEDCGLELNEISTCYLYNLSAGRNCYLGWQDIYTGLTNTAVESFVKNWNESI